MYTEDLRLIDFRDVSDTKIIKMFVSLDTYYQIVSRCENGEMADCTWNNPTNAKEAAEACCWWKD